jgi:hypothetical protein
MAGAVSRAGGGGAERPAITEWIGGQSSELVKAPFGKRSAGYKESPGLVVNGGFCHILRSLVMALMARCKLTPRAVKTHQQINIMHTRWPGVKFPANGFLESLKSPGH